MKLSIDWVLHGNSEGTAKESDETGIENGMNE
jgi:hypothetical protein